MTTVHDRGDDAVECPYDLADMVNLAVYADQGPPYRLWDWLRAHDPIRWVEPGQGTPSFWAVTRHEDIRRISHEPEVFQNEPRSAIFPGQDIGANVLGIRQLLEMDPPEHRQYRTMLSRRFTPASLETMRAYIERQALRTLQDFVEAAQDGPVEVMDVLAKPVPLHAICEMIGVPDADRETCAAWIDEFAGFMDPEVQGGGSALETLMHAVQSVFAYFSSLTAERAQDPRDDLVTELNRRATAGEEHEVRLTEMEQLAYYMLLFTGGAETTRTAIGAAMLAFAEFPGELAKLRRDPDLVQSAVEEILRWSNPVAHFCRTPRIDVTVGDRLVRAGETMALWYPSANRDEAVFDEPYAFRVDRQPNPHLAFGIGEHFCLGSNMARFVLRTLIDLVAPVLEDVEVLQVDRLRHIVTPGFKRVRVRCALRADAMAMVADRLAAAAT